MTTATDATTAITTLLSSSKTVLGFGIGSDLHMAAPASQGEARQETNGALSTTLWMTVPIICINFACIIESSI